MKTLVIGGAGYIGSVLTRQLLQDGGEVTVLDTLRFGEESLADLFSHPQFRLCVGDLRDRSVLDQCMPGHDAVVLLAAIVGEPACNREPDLALEVNRVGAQQVSNTAKEHRIPRFVFASTCSNYGVQDPDELVDESAPLQPLSTYAESKVAAEKDILSLSDESFCATILRLSTAFGVSPRMRFDLMVSDFALAAIRSGQVVVFGEQFWRPFVHVEDISDAIRLVLRQAPEKVNGQVFNVGRNDNNLRKQDLAEMVIRNVPGSKLEYVQRNQDPRSYRVRFDRIERELGFQARWSVEQGVQEVVEQLQAGRWTNPDAKCYYN